MNPYSTNKALYYVDRLADLKCGHAIAPVHLQLILSDLCNHNCSFCAYRMDGSYSDMFAVKDENGALVKNPNRMLSTEDAVMILKDAAKMGVKAVQITGGGEPTVHPECAAIIEAAHTFGLQTALVTNGSKLNERMREALLKSTLSSWVRVSLDAAISETYKTIRGLNSNTAFEKVCMNIKELTSERNKIAPWVYVGISFVVTKENWEEIPAATELAKRLGADSIRFASNFTPENDNYYSDFGDEAEALCEEAKKQDDFSFKAINSLSERRGDLRLGPPDYDFCAYQYLTAYIGADMNSYTCCCNAYNKRGLIGSVKEQGFLGLWESQEKKEFMASFNARDCERCQFNSRNHEINALIEVIPLEHVNFI